MKKDSTEMFFILDRSGSMSRLVSDTIGGYNSLLEKNRAADGETLVSTVLFDDVIEVIHDRVPISDVSDLTSKEYYARGRTALLDAIGTTIKHVKQERKGMPEEDIPEKTVVVITTDGLENASREYSFSDIRKLITKARTKHGWEFLFLGADIDAVLEASKIGIEKDRSVRMMKDSDGLSLAFNTVADTLVEYKQCCRIMPDWSKEIAEDYKKRGQEHD